MQRSIIISLWLAAAASPTALAQPASAGTTLHDQQQLGMRLFNQSCRVCHIKPQATSPQYAPVLSRDSLGGQELALRTMISNGTAHMPGFKYHFRPAEIDAVVSYIQTVAAPTAASKPSGARNDSREAD
jgi:mono/diheme cytochrome c family protein